MKMRVGRGKDIPPAIITAVTVIVSITTAAIMAMAMIMVAAVPLIVTLSSIRSS